MKHVLHRDRPLAIHGARVLPSAELLRMKAGEECFVLVAVAAPGRERPEARDEIRAHLVAFGLEELRDFIGVA